MGGQPADDLRLVGVEFALPQFHHPLRELAVGQPLGHRAGIQMQFPGNLRPSEVLVLVQVFEATIALVIDHGWPPTR